MKWIDMHCDTLSELIKRRRSGENETFRDNTLAVDISRLKRAGAAAQFFACYVNAAEFKRTQEEAGYTVPQGLPVRPEQKWRWDAAYSEVMKMIGLAYAESGSPDLKIARTLKDIPAHDVRASRASRAEYVDDDQLAAVLTVEEGGVLSGNMHRLEELYERGVRLITLTWNHENCIGYPVSRKRDVMDRGLKEFGIQTVEQMNALGMIVDVSHLSDGGFWDCIRHSRAPVAATHSNARSLCRHPRNLSDEMLRALGETGGVAGVNFYTAFLRESGKASAEDIASHAAWIIAKGGEDTPALGSDLDGFDVSFLPQGIRGVQDMDRVWEAMKRRGITARQIDKIAYGNAERLMGEVWRR